MNLTGWLPEDTLRGPDGKVRPIAWLLLATVLFMAASHIAQLWLLILPSGQFKALHLGLALIVVFLTRAQLENGWARRILGVALAVLSLLCCAYVIWMFDALVNERMFGPSAGDMVVGSALLVVTLIATASTWGWTIPVLAVLTLLYASFGNVFESHLLYHSGVSFDRLISYTSIPFFQGLLGSMTGQSASLIFIFMIFAGLLKSTGGIDFILTVAGRLGGRTAGGPAKVAVIGSGLMGMISGSTVANVASTGTITIPLMKQNGFKPEQAGAIEAVASNGGQFMPPIMGLTAFLIAGMTGISYPTIMFAALMPALIYYGNLLVAVHFLAVAQGLRGISGDGKAAAALRVGAEVKQYLHLIAGLVLLVYLLSVAIPPAHSGMIASAFIVVAEFGKQLYIHRNAPMEGVRATCRRVISGLYDGVGNGAQIAVVIGAIGIIVDMLTVTGFAQKLSNIMLSVAGDGPWMLLLLAAISCLVFGLGMPTPAAYSIVAVLAAPALVDYGIDVLAAHMYVFFYANMSAVTPPVALAALVGAKIAGADYMRTAIKATCLGLPGFILPVMFIISPELLMLEGSVAQRGLTFVAVLAMFVALNAAISGTTFERGMPIVMRSAMLICAALLAWPSPVIRIAGLALLAIAFVVEHRRSGAHTASPIPATK
ncbi:TRAP transporter permease [Paracoccus angustae]|uniref:TRAP transporter permease n=1 Tax=Paracoccus angustae TaxID=1671480 RepID=A0ABV7U7V6_9RHOB